MDEFTWLTLPVTGGVNRFPADSVEAWRARGWVPCDPPAWADPTRAHLADVEVPVQLAAPKTSRRFAGNSTDEEKA